MIYNGFYINLDRNPERRKGIEEELKRSGFGGYTRFPATLGNALNFPNPHLKAGEVGCFTSHYLLLKNNQYQSSPLHIMEDDIVLSPQLHQVLSWTIESGKLAQYDIIFTDVAVPLLNDACHAYKKFYDTTVKRGPDGKIEQVAFNVIDMRELIFGSTCSFLVNPQSISKLVALYEAELIRGATLPIDLYIRKLCQDGAIRVGCIFPFITSIRPESCFATTMEKRFDELPAMASNMLRHSFFIGCDWQQCLDYAERIFPQPEATDTHRQLMEQLLNYSLMPDYKKC
jgi:hypothetical protein